MKRLALVSLLALAGCATSSDYVGKYPASYYPSVLKQPAYASPIPATTLHRQQMALDAAYAPAVFPRPSVLTAPVFQQREQVTTTCTYAGSKSICTTN